MRLVLIALAFLFFSLKTAPISAPEPTYPYKKIIQYSFSVKNVANTTLENVGFYTYAPVELTSTQRVTKLDASHAYELQKDKYHNQVMQFHFDRLAPFETRIVRVRAELEMADVANGYTHTKASDFLAAEPYVESSDDAIDARAKNLLRESAAETAKAIYTFVNQHIEYRGYIKDDRGALSALQHRVGDCTEYSYLVSALSRNLGIPARAIGGYVYESNATFKPRDYHNWAEVFWDGAWHIVDAQNQLFIENQSHFVAMRVIAADASKLLGSSHQFVFSDPRVEVQMN